LSFALMLVTHIATLSTITHDVTNQVTHRIPTFALKSDSKI